MLEVGMWGLGGIGAEGHKEESGLHGFEGERVDLDGIEKVLAALPAGKKIVDPGGEQVTSELPGMTAAFNVQGFGEMQAVVASLAGAQGGASHPIGGGRGF